MPSCMIVPPPMMGVPRLDRPSRSTGIPADAATGVEHNPVMILSIRSRRSAAPREETMIKASRIGHATFSTPDLDRAIAYYTEVTGLVLNSRDRSRAFLASKTGLLTIALEQGNEARLLRLSFEVSPHMDFTD